MSSPRHEIPVAGSSPRPDVLTEATDLNTLFEALVGKTPAPSRPPTGAGESEEVPRPAPYMARTPDRRASASATPVPEIKAIAEPSPPSEVRPEPLVSTSLVESIDADSPVEDEDPIAEDATTNASLFGRLRIVRTSPWPVMVLVGGMAIVTVSAIGLRSGSSTPANPVPPAVASPPTTLPDGYLAQLPTAPVSVNEQTVPPSTAVGDSPWKPTGPTARGSTAPAAAPPIVTSPVTAKPAAARATPMVSAPATVAAPAPPAAPPPQPAVAEEPPVEAQPEAVTLVEPLSTLEPKNDTPVPAPAPPAVSSAPTTSAVVGEPVPELPKPATSRTVMPVVAARRLTGGMPEYSAALRQRRVGGVVDVQIRIDLNGRVVSAIALSGPPPLREVAEAAVLKWRYAPATRNGIPIETESKVTFSFDPSQSRRQ